MKRRTFLQSACTFSAALLADGLAFAADPVADLYSRPFLDVDGQSHRLSEWKGRPLVVNFWATWCAPCVKEMPELDALQKRFPKAQFVGIGIDTADNIRKFTQKVPVSYPLLLGGPSGIDLMRALGNGLGALPFTMIFDAVGRISHQVLGAVDSADLTQRLAALQG
jgi:thiol-disulfide isomerase/thioredoxin